MAMRSYDEIQKETTTTYLDAIDMNNIPDPITLQGELLEQVAAAFQVENTLRSKDMKLRIPHKLTPAQIADIIIKLHPVVNIAYGGLNVDTEYDILSLYQTDGEDEGIYTARKQAFVRLIRQYSYTMTEKEIKETISLIRNEAPRKERNSDKNLIAVNNGIFDYDTKQLMPFSPEYVFISKSKVNYNPSAVNKVITEPDGTPWNIESWIDDLFDGNKDLSKLIWQIIGAIIRPNVSWNKSAWFYSESGNNGKGTLCSLMRQIAGSGTYTSISLANFSKDFMLEPLISASCIIVDENDVGTYIDKAANLKAVITGDPIQINRKFKEAIAYKFKGFMVQCVNEMPRIKDKSESLARRILIVPFTKCFTGSEKKYIKDEYLKDKEVLEYALKKVLESDYYELDEPKECRDALAEYKTFNDPIQQFIDEILPECKWNLLPYQFLYDLYASWFKKNSPSGYPVSKQIFIKELKQLIQNSSEWTITSGKTRPADKMKEAEPLIYQYNLSANWRNPAYIGNEIEKICHPKLKEHYEGLLRKG